MAVIIIIILAFDQSTKKTGYAVFDSGKLIKHGLIISNPSDGAIARMASQHRQAAAIIQDCDPDAVCLEAAQFQKNQAAFGTLSQMQGVYFALLFKQGTPFVIVEPSAWRSALGIGGRRRDEQKAAAIQAVKEWYGLDVSEDEAEAICIGRWCIQYFNNGKDAHGI